MGFTIQAEKTQAISSILILLQQIALSITQNLWIRTKNRVVHFHFKELHEEKKAKNS
jgi:hypothetical protein